MRISTKGRYGLIVLGVFVATFVTACNPTGKLEWAPRHLRVKARAGSTTEETARFTYQGPDIADPQVVLKGPAAEVITAVPERMRPTGDGAFELPLTITVPAGARWHFPGVLRLEDGERPVGPALPVWVDVADGGDIPQSPSRPSPDRITAGPQQVPVVSDELVVGVAPDAPDPATVATEAAAASGGQVVGAVPELGLYQVRYPGASPTVTEGKVPVVEAATSVEFANLNIVDTDMEAIPDDPNWDSWDVAAPAGNNWGLEAINAPQGWESATGAPSTRIGVIDTDNDEDHGDLDDNVVNTDRGGLAGGHGTHVAGTACAEGDNGTGITGVMWDCELGFYAYGGNLVSTAGRMVDAVNDGSRVVNMSLQFVENNTEIAITPRIAELVDSANDVLERGILYAQRTDRDVLWTFAAGNENRRDVRFTAPGGLALRFPTNTMAVAAVDQDGALAGFSNTGEGISVAAPGVEVYSTLPREGCWLFTIGCEDQYGTKSGTSMAAPHVTGLAGLLFSADPDRTAADVKTCIVGGAERDGAPVPGHPFSVIDVPAVLECEGTVDLPAVVDIVFAFDLTGSMGGVLNQAKSEAQGMVADIAAAAPGSDISYAVVSHEDYPGSFDSGPCGSSYAATYGASSDEPFRVTAGSTGDGAAIQDAIGGLSLGSGSDGPESYGRALWEVAQPDTADTLGLRDDALTIIVNFADNVPHDPHLTAGVENVRDQFDTGIDPGRNGTIDCGGDDIDFQDDTLAELVADDTRLLHVDSGSGSFEPYWRNWTATTGGAYTRLGDRSLSEVVLELLTLL